jgi:hypothetical protein
MRFGWFMLDAYGNNTVLPEVVALCTMRHRLLMQKQ